MCLQRTGTVRRREALQGATFTAPIAPDRAPSLLHRRRSLQLAHVTQTILHPTICTSETTISAYKITRYNNNFEQPLS